MTAVYTDTPRIYVASLSDYNAGRLHGAWIDADQSADAIMAEIGAMLATSPEPIAEEWAIHDIDNFAGLRIDEHESIEHVAELAQLLMEHGPAVAEYIQYTGDTDASGFEESYEGTHASEQDFAETLADDIGMFGDWSDTAKNYFDWDAWTRDLFMGDYFSVDAGYDGVYIFRSL